MGLVLLTATPLGVTLLAEHSKGIFLGGALSRGASKIIVAGTEKKTVRQYPIVDQMNFSKEKKDSVQFGTWQDVTEDTSPRFNSLLLAGNYDFSELLTAVHPTLVDGANIVLYCLSSEPLVKAAREMSARGYLNITLMDSWARTYQVLANRTHPMMSMDSCSGFLLHAFKVTQ